MAEEIPAIRNKKLLVVALILAAIVVVIYNVHITQVRKAGRGQMVDLLKFRNDMDTGQVVTKKNIRVEQVDRMYYKSLGNVVARKDYDLVVGSVMNQSARKDQFVKYAHVTATEGGGPASRLGKNMVAVSLEIDPRNVPGDILRVYDRVNILAKLSVSKGRLKTYRVIKSVRVLAVGGRGEQTKRISNRGARTASMPRSYRSITVEIPEKISLELSNVLSHRVGSISLELCGGSTPDPAAGKISSQLQPLAQYANPGAKHRTTSISR